MHTTIRQASHISAEARRQAEHLRRQIAAIEDCGVDELVEWNTRICPDCQRDVLSVSLCAYNSLPHLPPLYYALAVEDALGDRPLGLGESEVLALSDLLWNIKANRLCDDLRLA